MTAEPPAIDPTAFDFAHPIAGIAEIRAANPHRHEFEMLSGVVHVDTVAKRIVGFKDVRPDEFWVRGHMPGFPLLPGVLMCEAAAQLCGYYYVSQKVGDLGVLMGLGGLDEARFLRTVRPGERLVLVGTGIKVHRRLTRFQVTGFVGREKTFEVVVTGVPLGKLEELVGA
jgi:3-hydroxyacyl-[acyl-carrier-protein] dehydratase